MNEENNVYVSVHSRIPAKVSRVDEQDSSTGHRSWSSCLQMADLKQQPHARCQRNALVTSQGENLQQNTSHHHFLEYC